MPTIYIYIYITYIYIYKLYLYPIYFCIYICIHNPYLIYICNLYIGLLKDSQCYLSSTLKSASPLLCHLLSPSLQLGPQRSAAGCGPGLGAVTLPGSFLEKQILRLLSRPLHQISGAQECASSSAPRGFCWGWLLLKPVAFAFLLTSGTWLFRPVLQHWGTGPKARRQILPSPGVEVGKDSKLASRTRPPSLGSPYVQFLVELEPSHPLHVVYGMSAGGL